MSNALQRFVHSLMPSQALGLSAAWTAAIGVADHLTGYQVSLAIFYLVPVGLTTWYVGKWTGYGFALFCSAASLSADLAAGHLSTRPALMAWNGLVHLGFFLVTARLLHALRGHLEFEQQLARTDTVTRVGNRLAFEERLEYSLKLAERTGRPLTLAYVDLDDFKSVNDAFGHDEGDRLLRLVAQTMRDALRAADSVARLGGDEFALLLPDTDGDGAQRVILKARQTLQDVFADEPCAITCSIGAVTFCEPLPNAVVALRRADELMYEVKGQGKNAVEFKSQSSREQLAV